MATWRFVKIVEAHFGVILHIFGQICLCQVAAMEQASDPLLLERY